MHRAWLEPTVVREVILKSDCSYPLGHRGPDIRKVTTTNIPVYSSPTTRQI